MRIFLSVWDLEADVQMLLFFRLASCLSFRTSLAWTLKTYESRNTFAQGVGVIAPFYQPKVSEIVCSMYTNFFQISNLQFHFWYFSKKTICLQICTYLLVFSFSEDQKHRRIHAGLGSHLPCMSLLLFSRRFFFQHASDLPTPVWTHWFSLYQPHAVKFVSWVCQWLPCACVSIFSDKMQGQNCCLPS